MTRGDWTEPKDASKPVRWPDLRRAQGRKQPAQLRELAYAAKAVKLVLRSFLLLGEHASHDMNLRALRVIHVGGEVEQDGILASSWCVEEILHHNQGAR